MSLLRAHDRGRLCPRLKFSSKIAWLSYGQWDINGKDTQAFFKSGCDLPFTFVPAQAGVPSWTPQRRAWCSARQNHWREPGSLT